MSFINVQYPLKIIRSNSVGCFEVIELLISSNKFMRVKEYCYKLASREHEDNRFDLFPKLCQNFYFVLVTKISN